MNITDLVHRYAEIFRARMLAMPRWQLPPEDDDDPLSFVREPKPVLPGGRLASIAVDEPDSDDADDACVAVIGGPEIR